MISNCVQGKGFRGCINYVSQKKGAELLDKNFVGNSARLMAKEVGLIRELRPNLQSAVFHASLSADKSDNISPDKWVQIGKAYLAKMGFDNNQYAIYRHTDTDDDHIHIVVNRIKMDGEVVKDYQYKERSLEAVREIEKEFGLKQLKSPDRLVRGMKSGEYRMEKNGYISIKRQLQHNIEKIARQSSDLSDFIKRCSDNKIDLRFNIQSTGRVFGISYGFDGFLVKGSLLGKNFSFLGLQNNLGVKYDPQRDMEAIIQANKLSEEKELMKLMADEGEGGNAGRYLGNKRSKLYLYFPMSTKAAIEGMMMELLMILNSIIKGNHSKNDLNRIDKIVYDSLKAKDNNVIKVLNDELLNLNDLQIRK